MTPNEAIIAAINSRRHKDTVMNRLANDVFPDDLFTSGTRVNLFYKTRYLGGTCIGGKEPTE